jgi:Putative zinc-finger
VTPQPQPPGGEPHLDVAAYALGVLDDADATAFEEHLAGCEACQNELDELIGVESVLAEYAATQTPPAPSAQASTVRSPTIQAPAPAQPAAQSPPQAADPMLDRLIAEVAASRHKSRVRRIYALAAAIVLIAGGPLAVGILGSGSTATPPHQAHATAGPLPITGRQFSATNPATGVSATVGLAPMAWGTHVALELSGVQGPLTCDLVAVSAAGQRQTVASWQVPATGYGVTGNAAPLVLYGGAGMAPADINHFEVQTTTGQVLLTIPL